MTTALDEALIAGYMKAVQVQTKSADKARTVKCPTCGAGPGAQCGFVTFDDRFGEDFPVSHVHTERYDAYQEAVAKEIAGML